MEGRRRKKKPLSRLAKTFLSYALIAALALPPQAAWADGQSLADGNAAGDDSLAVGEGAGAYAEGSIAIGRNAVAETDGEYALAVGYSAKASGKNSVAIGYNSVASEAYTVSVGGNGTTRRIVNVAESTADTDAATVGQLASLGSEVARIVGGQGLTYDGKSFTGAAVNIGGKDYETIEAALNALYAGTAGSTGGAVSGDEIVIDPSKDAVTIARGGNIQITRDAEDDNKFTIGVSESPIFSAVCADNANIGGITVGSGGINLGGKKITGLADGSIAPGSTDAVTGGQLWNAYKRMDDLNESINIVGAHAAALSGLHPIQYNPYEPTTLSAAVGTYRDEYAVAVGVFHYVRSNVLFNLGASICSDGDVMGRAGVSLAVGKGGRKKPELARDMVGMQQQMIAMQAMLEELRLDTMQVSARNILDGILVDQLRRLGYGTQPVPGGIREQSVQRLARRCNFEERHARHMLSLTLQLHDSAVDCGLISPDRQSRELLCHAALLHDIGIFIAYPKHAQHSHYLIRNTELLGFTQDEIEFMAQLALLHGKGPSRKQENASTEGLGQLAQRLRPCALFLSLAEALDRTHCQNVHTAEFRRDGNAIRLHIAGNGNCLVEQDAIKGMDKAVKKGLGRDIPLTFSSRGNASPR